MKRNYWNLKEWRVRDWIGLTVILIMCLTGSFLITQYDKNLQEKRYAEERAQAQRLLDKQVTESETQPPSTPVLNNPSDQPAEHPTEKTAYKDRNARMEALRNSVHVDTPGAIITFHDTDQPYRYQDGIYKGMTYSEAYTAWKTKKDEILDRFLASTDKTVELAEAKIDSADAKLSTLLTIFKTMSPKELEIAKSETLKDYPEKADEIESFFSDVANHDTTKSFEEIANDYQFILESDKAIWAATYKNRAEFDKISAELKQVNKDEPQHPNFQ